MTLFHDKLNEGLTDDRLTRIQHNIMALSEAELNQQAIRLELAVHKLSSAFDKLAEDHCNEQMQEHERSRTNQQRYNPNTANPNLGIVSHPSII